MSSTSFQPINIYNYLKQLGTTSTGHNNLSLLKELFDNSFDADSTNIVVKKVEGTNDKGLKYYRIIYIDDGNGMNRQDLYRCVQLYSENKNGGIGKFGIGGASTLVNWCDIDERKYNSEYEKFIRIVTKSKDDGITRTVKINWNKCKTIKDYTSQVESSYSENEKKALNIIKNNEITHGTYIIIQTSEEKYSEIIDIGHDMDDYINIGTTYQYYLEKGAAITLFDESIKHFAFQDSVLSDSILIEIFTRKTHFAYLAKIGKKRICYKYDKSEQGKMIKEEELEGSWNNLCDVTLKLEMPTDIYTPKRALHSTRSDDQFKVGTWSSFINFCKINEITCQKDINTLARQYIEQLYIVRKDVRENKRTLGGLDIGVSHTHGGSTTISKYIKKQLIITSKDDERLSLVQQNKSVIEWTNSPKGLKNFIKKIITHWCTNKLEPKLEELDIKEQQVRNFNRPLELSLEKKLQYIARMRNNKFTPTYLNESTPLSAGNVILRAIRTRIQQKRRAIITIQRWFRNQKKTNGPIKGFIKFQRFMKWSYQSYYITKIQRWFRNIILKKAIINYVLSTICVRINKRKSVQIIEKAWIRYQIRKSASKTEDNAALILQKYVRRFLAIRHVKYEKEKQAKFMGISRNFINDISFPKSRQDFTKFKRGVLTKLDEMERLL